MNIHTRKAIEQLEAKLERQKAAVEQTEHMLAFWKKNADEQKALPLDAEGPRKTR